MKNPIVGQYFKVGPDGFVALVDHMGADDDIVRAARISYGLGTKAVSDSATLIRYLFRNRHTSPVEMVEMKFHIKVPMDAWRQWIRHRMASVNEYSTRYSDAIDTVAATLPGEWRLQSGSNKQGSSGLLGDWDEIPQNDQTLAAFQSLTEPVEASSPGRYLSERERLLHRVGREVYEERLAFGVAREQARKDLPLSTYTEAIWKIDLHNLLHFLSLRMDSHAQLEIRQFADVIGKQIVAAVCPVSWGAFLDYRFNAMQLSALDIAALRQTMVIGFSMPAIAEAAASGFVNARERGEFIVKACKLAGHENLIGDCTDMATLAANRNKHTGPIAS